MIERENGGFGVDQNDLGELSSRLRRDIRRRGVDANTADDLVQEAWLRTLRRPPLAADREGLGRWFSVVGRRLVAELRRTDGHRTLRERAAARPERVPAPEPGAGDARVLELVRGLPEPYRTVLRRHYLEDARVEEIAAELGRSPATVRSQLARGLEHLRLRLAHEPPERRSPALLLLARLSAPLRTARALRVAAGLAVAAAVVVVLALARPEDELRAGAPTAAAAGDLPASRVASGARVPLVAEAAAADGSPLESAAFPVPMPMAARALAGVVRAPDGAPVAGAEIWLGERLGAGASVARSDDAGRWALEAVEGRRFLWACHADWPPSRRAYVAALAGGGALELVLGATRGRLELSVLTPEGAPAPGLRVVLDGERGGDASLATAAGALELETPFALEATTDARGLARLPKPDRAYARCQVWRGEALVACRELWLTDDAQTLALVLPAPAELDGLVLDPAGNPAADAEVEVRQFDQGVFVRARADAAGRFATAGLLPGPFVASARVGAATVVQPGALDAGERRSVTLVTRPRGLLGGRALDATGLPLAGARVALYRGGLPGHPEDAWQLTGADGRFGFVCLDDVAYRLELQAAGARFVGAAAEDLRAGDEVELRLRPEELALEALTVELVGAAPGELPTLASLRRWRPRLTSEEPVDARTGRVTFLVPRGEYELAVWVPGVGAWRARGHVASGPGVRRIVLPRPGELELVLELPADLRDGAAPVFAAELELRNAPAFGFEALTMPAHRRQLATGPDGRSLVARLFPDVYTLELRAPGLAGLAEKLTIREGEHMRLVRAPRPGLVLEVVLVFPRGAASEEGLELWAEGPAGRRRLEPAGVRRTEAGLALSVRVPEGTQRLTARATRGATGAVELRAMELGAEAHAPLTLELWE